MTKKEINEFSMRISQSNKTEIVVITYEIIINYLESAKEALKIDNKEEFVFNLKKSRQFVNQLSTALDFKYEISRELMSLYMFANDRILKSELRLKDVNIDDVIKMMSELREAFLEVCKFDTTKPAMTGGETVYEGLTYGKNARGTIMVSK